MRPYVLLLLIVVFVALCVVESKPVERSNKDRVKRQWGLGPPPWGWGPRPPPRSPRPRRPRPRPVQQVNVTTIKCHSRIDDDELSQAEQVEDEKARAKEGWRQSDGKKKKKSGGDKEGKSPGTSGLNAGNTNVNISVTGNQIRKN